MVFDLPSHGLLSTAQVHLHLHSLVTRFDGSAYFLTTDCVKAVVNPDQDQHQKFVVEMK